MEEKKAGSVGKMTLEDYFKTPDLRVKRGELGEILAGILTNVDNQLTESFRNVVSVVNMSEIMLQALTKKGLITEKDIQDAKEDLIKANNIEVPKGGETDDK